ncbi:MAG TPA: GMC family oxidoreductase [Solirubrobacteraceae bacterium]|jgi:choline dehydrogenase-like flavoprotein|nr:GMC family oxidoreductase [Solirubrobacteraceae bacterium]
MNAERYDVVVVGSGAGGGLVAGEVADSGASVLLLEAGPHRTAADFTRWEAHANHDIWFPPTLVEPAAEGAPPLAVIRGRCVGGTSTVNTKVALRPSHEDYAKWHVAAGLTGADGGAFGAGDMTPHFERVEARLGVRERSDWQQCIRTVVPGFAAMDAELQPVMSYTDANCMRCGSCLQGCPTNAGKNSMNVYIHPPWAAGRLTLRAECTVSRVLIEDRGAGLEATGVEYTDADGASHTVQANVVVVAGGAMATSHLLLRSGIPEASGGSASSRLIGRNVGWHPARILAGLFDEPQDAHRVYPISAHCMKFQSDADGGFIVEAATIQDPIGFAVMVCDEDGVPMWGRQLTETTRRYRYFTGLLTMVTDQNNGTAWIDEDGRDRWSYEFNEVERERDGAALSFAREVLLAAGAKRVLPTGQSSTHVQGGCRMGSDPERSVVDAHAESHDVRRLFVGDGSVIPCTLSVNPSLTIMALASRLAQYLAGAEHGYFGRARAQAVA